MFYFIFLIGEGIAHAKVANPTTLLTRFAEELRRAPGAGPDAGRGADAERKGRWVIGYWGLEGGYELGKFKSVNVRM
jgi:hypothetical protein